ncbi:hypothetical protein [Bacillus massiliigorillae]|uniref:hypothetical protein n=1 Tax=Bacillus massiliigorillae TaxID=1243664 RepID=UPI0003A9381C|nr:hypothetical protein [Bacillus massiliigorillae]
MFKKKSLFLALILCVVLVISACSDKTSTEKEDKDVGKTDAKSNFLLVSGDTVSEQGGCVLASRYTVGDKIVFRMDAIDPDTNKQAEGAVLKVHLSTGEVLDMEYGEHPPKAENAAKFWVAAYQVTDKTPAGTLNYHVTAEKGDKKGEFSPFNVAQSLLTIVAADAVNGKNQEAKVTEEKKPELKEEVKTNQNIDLVATNFKFNQDTFYVKAGEEVTLKLTSKEGTHGVSISGLNVSLDKPNGTVKFTPKEAGEYQIACNVFCGEGHGGMISKLVVVK